MEGEQIEQKSASMLEWRLVPADERLVSRLVQSFQVPDVAARVMLARGVAPDLAESFIAPQIKKLMPDPCVMKDMDKAAARVARAVLDGEGIGIFGDYDVDGATSSAIMHRFLRAAGVSNISVHIPDRQTEGYGLNEGGIARLKSLGASLVIAVDCGITGFAAAEAARGMGLDLVIADHHESEVSVPPAAAVVDAKRVDDESGLAYLAACGVAFLMCVATNRILREAGHYKDRVEPDLFSLLDLVAFGTVCDVVPLVGVNRAFVAAGLKVLAKRQNMGLKALCDVSGVSNAPTSFDLGYVLGPRINAGGRVGDSTFGERLLATDDRLAAEHLAQSLNSFNADRKAIETAVIQAAEDKISSEMSPGDAFVFISGENWHTGVIGIIAGRIKEKYRLPAFVATIDGAGMANGSGRSVPGVDIGAAIIKAKEQGILSEGGGHPMAAGFTLPADRIPRFKEFLRDFIASSGKASLPTLAIDAVVDIAGINAELVKSLAILEPFGAGNEEPRFAVLDARLSSSDAIGGGNIRCFFAGDNGRSVGAILYRGYDTPLGEALLGGEGKRFKVAGKIRTNEYMGRSSLQLVIDDIAEIGGL